jgi:thymidine kinase
VLRRVRRYQHARCTVLVVKYEGDTRYSGSASLSTHDRNEMPAVSATRLLPLLSAPECAAAHVVAVDEGQFFPDLPEFCAAALAAGKSVIVSALDGDFRRRPFGRVLELIPTAEEVTKLSAVCVTCTRAAAFTKRTVASEALELVGGAESYVPTCRECFGSSAPASPPKRAPGGGAAAAADAADSGSSSSGGSGNSDPRHGSPLFGEPEPGAAVASPPFLLRLEAVGGS